MYTEVKPTWTFVIEFPSKVQVTFESAEYALETLLKACLEIGYPPVSASATSFPKLIVCLTFDNFEVCHEFERQSAKAIALYVEWANRHGFPHS